MSRLKITLDNHTLYVSEYLLCKGNLFLRLINENKEPFQGNVICVNNHFEVLHRFVENKATGIWTNQESLIIDCSGYQFYFEPTNFISQTIDWGK